MSQITKGYAYIRHISAFAALLLVVIPVASANIYISASYGINDQDDSSNDGRFTGDFTTGTVTGVNPPLNIPSSSPVGWKTDFDNGDAYSLALGWQHEHFRIELEYAYSDSDVDTHTGVSAAGLDLSAIDAGVLIAGNVGDLGVSVADLVADGRGEIENTLFFINGYYDFANNTAFTPYVGAGIGYSNVDVTYRPSGVGVINSDDDVFVYQLMVGIAYKVTDPVDVTLNARYRDGDEASVESSLLPANFDIENQSWIFDLGVRYTF